MSADTGTFPGFVDALYIQMDKAARTKNKDVYRQFGQQAVEKIISELFQDPQQKLDLLLKISTQTLHQVAD